MIFHHPIFSDRSKNPTNLFSFSVSFRPAHELVWPSQEVKEVTQDMAEHWVGMPASYPILLFRASRDSFGPDGSAGRRLAGWLRFHDGG